MKLDYGLGQKFEIRKISKAISSKFFKKLKIFLENVNKFNLKRI